MPKEEIEEYLEAIFDLSQDGKPASTNSIALHLKVKPSSVTEALQRMAKNSLVEYTPYRGVSLTKNGIQIALKIKRKHRLLECFFHDVLKVKGEMHEQACKMEHHLSDNAEKALAKFLKNPKKCPDGKIIPPELKKQKF